MSAAGRWELSTGAAGRLYSLKRTLFVLASNIIGFAEGYLLQGLGLQWLLPILIVTAVAAVLVSRWCVK
jgi:hypothetical protein